ncbi:MAG: hypothetical protein AB1486_09185 [Planctomycetota bacterium]
MNARIWIIGGLVVAIAAVAFVPFGPREETERITAKDALRRRAEEKWTARIQTNWLEEYGYVCAEVKKLQPVGDYLGTKANFDFREFTIKDVKVNDDGTGEVVVDYRFINRNPLLMQANKGLPFDDRVTVTDYWVWENGNWFWQKVGRPEAPVAEPAPTPTGPRAQEAPSKVRGIDFSGSKSTLPGVDGGAQGAGKSKVQQEGDSGR